MNIRKLSVLLVILLILVSCGSGKTIQAVNDTRKQPVYEESSEVLNVPETPLETENLEEGLQSKIISYAKEFLGTSYQFGGTSPEGIDCSGLIYTVFSLEDIQLPRTSRDMAKLGENLNVRQVSQGDLLFFQTNPKNRTINHVGLVIRASEEEVVFIHSTTSRGVIISSLSEKYWQDHFVMAKRIL